MDRFPTPQPHDRTHGPAPFAPGDGLAQGMTYTAVIQSAPSSEGTVQVTVPALHLSQSIVAHIQPGTVCSVGETCCVSFDEKKIPWVVTGLWPAVSLSTAEGRIAALEAKLADSGWKEPTLLNAFVNSGGGKATCAYRKQGNIVRLRGTVKAGGDGLEVFTLPEGFRPTAELELHLTRGGATAELIITVTATGKVNAHFNGTGQISFDGITFTID